MIGLARRNINFNYKLLLAAFNITLATASVTGTTLCRAHLAATDGSAREAIDMGKQFVEGHANDHLATDSWASDRPISYGLAESRARHLNTKSEALARFSEVVKYFSEHPDSDPSNPAKGFAAIFRGAEVGTFLDTLNPAELDKSEPSDVEGPGSNSARLQIAPTKVELSIKLVQAVLDHPDVILVPFGYACGLACIGILKSMSAISFTEAAVLGALSLPIPFYLKARMYRRIEQRLYSANPTFYGQLRSKRAADERRNEKPFAMEEGRQYWDHFVEMQRLISGEENLPEGEFLYFAANSEDVASGEAATPPAHTRFDLVFTMNAGEPLLMVFRRP